MPEAQNNSKKKHSWSWVLWWQIDSDELNSQVDNYASLSLFKSARGWAVLCILLSVAVSIAAVAFKFSDDSAYIDAGILAFLGCFIYFGHRWAMLVAMLVWTLEKGYLLSLGIDAGTKGGPLVSQLIWWCIYMHAFYFAFRVEQARRNRAAQLPQSLTYR